MNKDKKKKRTVFAAAIVIAAALLFFRKGDSAIEVTVSQAKSGIIEDAVPASGKVRPIVEVKISPDVSGEIVELNCQEGDTVSKGDVIIRIREDLYVSQVEQAEAALRSMEAELRRQEAECEQARVNLTRTEYLYNNNAVSLSEYEAASAEAEVMAERVNAAKFGVLNSEAQLRETQENLKKTTILAPMSGIISRLFVEKGERVVGTSQMAGTEMLRIADFSRMEAIVDVGESDIVRLRCGDSAEVAVDAYPDSKFRGIVTQIANSAKNIGTTFEQVTNFEVRIEIVGRMWGEAPSPVLLPGMSATVSINTQPSDECITVPLESVFTDRGKTFVWVVGEDSKVSARQIHTGMQDLNGIEVKSGIEEGETLVTGPPQAVDNTLSESCKVKLANSSKR
ncbi:MAG: efflux RND transporter periplasmic adaptor subunit [Bacteroidales bacterium]|nr:efflux RND transporter periplasmic adaptor subunit [Candidatus Cacconaster merdequi]